MTLRVSRAPRANAADVMEPRQHPAADQRETGLTKCGSLIGWDTASQTHMLEAGDDRRTIQVLMAHAKLAHITVDLHLSHRHLHAVGGDSGAPPALVCEVRSQDLLVTHRLLSPS